MRIYPINQSPVMFRGSNKQQHTTMKRYCEPRTGAYYYYDPEKVKNENSVSKFFRNMFKNVSNEARDTFTLSGSNSDNDDILWL